MELDTLLNMEHPPEEDDFNLSKDDIKRLFWKYKGLKLESERNNRFWKATNENLTMAYEQLNEQEKELERIYNLIQEDLNVAHGIQKALFPSQSKDESIPFDIAFYNKQLDKVGGDYFDLFSTKEGYNAIGVFDISGHGVSAALIMAYLKSQVMLFMKNMDSPKKIIEYINDISLPFFKTIKRYVAVNLVVVKDYFIKYVCAGGFGLLVHDQNYYSFKKNHNFLGLRKGKFREYALPIAEHDLLVLYTDGIVEAQNREQSDYSTRRLNQLILKHRNKEVNEILDICIDDYKEFRYRDRDDITLFILRF